MMMMMIVITIIVIQLIVNLIHSLFSLPTLYGKFYLRQGNICLNVWMHCIFNPLVFSVRVDDGHILIPWDSVL